MTNKPDGGPIMPNNDPRRDAVRAEIMEFMRLRFELDIGGGDANVLARDVLAVADAAAPSPWRPIEEAPKDGTHILAYEGTGNAYRAAWNREGYWEAYCGQYVTEAPQPEMFVPWSTLPPLPLKEGE